MKPSKSRCITGILGWENGALHLQEEAEEISAVTRK